MDDLIAFLKARLDEDQAAADAVLEDSDYEAEWHEQTSGVLYVGPGSERYPLDGLLPLGDSRLTRFIACHDPARVLREVMAKHAIVALVAKTREWTDGSAGATAGYAAVVVSDTLRALAAPYRAHPDYRAEWRP